MTNKNSIEEILRSTLLLNNLTTKKLTALAQSMEIVQLKPNEVVFHQDEMGTDMYVVKAGAVKVVLADEHGREIVLNEYTEGKVFGELALLSQRPRAATVIATQESALYKLTRANFAQFVESSTPYSQTSVDSISEGLREHYKAQLLKRIPLFANLSERHLLNIVGNLDIHQFEHDHILFERGDRGDTLYIIMRGWVNAYVPSLDGEDIVLNQFGPGEMFGEMSLVDHKPRSANIRALTNLEVLSLHRDKFLGLIEQFPNLALSTLESLSGKMRFAATYVEQAVNWSQRVSTGDYSMVLEQIEATRDLIVGGDVSDDFRINALLSAFFKMIQGVQEREEALQQEISELKLKIEIDQQKRHDQVKSITENSSFAFLKQKAQEMRAKKEQAGSESEGKIDE